MGPFKQEYMIETSLQQHAFWRHCGFFKSISNQDWKVNQNAVKDSTAPTEKLLQRSSLGRKYLLQFFLSIVLPHFWGNNLQQNLSLAKNHLAAYV